MSSAAKWFLRLLIAGALAVAGSFVAAGSASASHDDDGVASKAARLASRSQGRTNKALELRASALNSPVRARAIDRTGTVRATNHRFFGGGPITADIVQRGDNEVDIDQDADARSGDCVAGSQVIGVVGRGSVRASNWSEDADCESGDARATNRIGSVHAGPRVIRDVGDDGDGGAAADLAVTKTFVGDGEFRQYRVVVTNNGPDAAQDVVLTDQPSTGTATVVPDLGTGFTCGPTGMTVTCQASTLAAGATAGFTVFTDTTLTRNTATVTAATPDPATENNTDTVLIEP